MVGERKRCEEDWRWCPGTPASPPTNPGAFREEFEGSTTCQFDPKPAVRFVSAILMERLFLLLTKGMRIGFVSESLSSRYLPHSTDMVSVQLGSMGGT